MIIQVNRLAYPITALGYGARIVLWLQGCSIRCDGCASHDTWNPEEGYSVEESDLVREIVDKTREYNLAGMTITGGEPSDQAEAVASLVLNVRRGLAEAEDDALAQFDVLVFSGRSEDAVRSLYPMLWDCADALICGPYEPSNPSSRWLVASDNQTVSLRTELAEMRYGDSSKKGKEIQFIVEDRGVTFAGITDSGDLARLEAELGNRGITLGGCSWRK